MAKHKIVNEDAVEDKVSAKVSSDKEREEALMKRMMEKESGVEIVPKVKAVEEAVSEPKKKAE